MRVQLLTGKRWFIWLVFEPRDLWVGAYWNRVIHTASDGHWTTFDLYVCLLPCLPLRFHRRSRP